MEPQVKIFLLCAPVNSGKTTALLNWKNSKTSVGGILAPDINNQRFLLRLKDDHQFEFQIHDDALSSLNPSEITNICKFNFFSSSFEKARNILLNDIGNNFEWMIVDEIGKLELVGKGLEPAPSNIIELVKKGQVNTKLILIVRESKLAELIVYYNLINYRVIGIEDLKHI